jgi:hypothetical protein
MCSYLIELLNKKLKKRSTNDEEIYLNQAQWLRPFSFNFIKHTTLKYKPTLITNTSNSDTIGIEMIEEKQENYFEREQNKPKLFASLKTYQYNSKKNSTNSNRTLSMAKIANYLNNSFRPNKCHFKVLKIYKIYKPEAQLFCKNKSCVDWKIKMMLENQLNGSYQAEIQPKSFYGTNLICTKLSDYKHYNFNQLLTEMCLLNISQNLVKIKWTIYLKSINCTNTNHLIDELRDNTTTYVDNDATRNSFECKLAYSLYTIFSITI